MIKRGFILLVVVSLFLVGGVFAAGVSFNTECESDLALMKVQSLEGGHASYWTDSEYDHKVCLLDGVKPKDKSLDYFLNQNNIDIPVYEGSSAFSGLFDSFSNLFNDKPSTSTYEGYHGCGEDNEHLVLWLSGEGNAHVSQVNSDSYDIGVCHSLLSSCSFKNSCDSDEMCVLGVTGKTNAHVVDCRLGAYDVCCSVPEGLDLGGEPVVGESVISNEVIDSCGDGFCSSVLGENCGSCTIDCGQCGGGGDNVCGNNVCEFYENVNNCPADCSGKEITKHECAVPGDTSGMFTEECVEEIDGNKVLKVKENGLEISSEGLVVTCEDSSDCCENYACYSSKYDDGSEVLEQIKNEDDMCSEINVDVNYCMLEKDKDPSSSYCLSDVDCDDKIYGSESVYEVHCSFSMLSALSSLGGTSLKVVKLVDGVEYSMGVCMGLSCDSDSDCSEGYGCDKGWCSNKFGEGESCTQDFECAGGLECNEGVCAVKKLKILCFEGQECESGYECIDNGCVLIDEDNLCTDVDCDSDEVCWEEDGECYSGFCEVDNDCDSGEECVDGEVCMLYDEADEYYGKKGGKAPCHGEECDSDQVCGWEYEIESGKYKVIDNNGDGFEWEGSYHPRCCDPSSTDVNLVESGSYTGGSPVCIQSVYDPATGSFKDLAHGECVDPDGDGVGTRTVKVVNENGMVLETKASEPCKMSIQEDDPLPLFGIFSVILTLSILTGFYVLRNRKA